MFEIDDFYESDHEILKEPWVGDKWEAETWTKENIAQECRDMQSEFLYPHIDIYTHDTENMELDSWLSMKLLNHPFADTRTLDYFFNSLSDFLQERKTYFRESCRTQSQKWFQDLQQFQVQKRHTECPICITEEFATCQHFMKCQECSGAVCVDCYPFIPIKKCPICRTPKSMIRICPKDKEEELLQLKPKTPTVREFVYQLRYQVAEGETDKNIFGETCDQQFNILKLDVMAFDYELAELIRVTQEHLDYLYHTLSPTEYREIVNRDFKWFNWE